MIRLIIVYNKARYLSLFTGLALSEGVSPRQHTTKLLALWRLILIALVMLTLLVWHYGYAPFQHWLASSVILAIAAGWSLLQLIVNRKNKRHYSIAWELLFDLAWVFALALFAGRAANPFIYYLLVLIATASLLLPAKQAWLFGLLSVTAYSALLFIDVQQHFHHFSDDYQIHLIGMWLNFVVSTGVVCLFITLLMSMLRKQEQRMRYAREKNLQDEQLIGLATVAASTVHNLATPLATLRLLIDDIDEAQTAKLQHKDDFELMRQQINRCHQTIDELSQIAQQSDPRSVTSSDDLLKDLQNHYSLHTPDAIIDYTNQLKATVYINSSPLLKHALYNLINNGIEATLDKTTVRLSKQQAYLAIAIENTCHSNVNSTLSRWGEPIISDKDTGLGIGTLLANSTIEQHQGEVDITLLNSSDNAKQQIIRVTVLLPCFTTL